MGPIPDAKQYSMLGLVVWGWFHGKWTPPTWSFCLKRDKKLAFFNPSNEDQQFSVVVDATTGIKYLTRSFSPNKFESSTPHTILADTPTSAVHQNMCVIAHRFLCDETGICVGLIIIMGPKHLQQWSVWKQKVLWKNFQENAPVQELCVKCVKKACIER